MGRQRVDSAAAEKACEAVRSGLMSQKAAAAAFGVGRTSLQRRLSGVCAMDARSGPRTVMTAAEEDAVEDLLLYAGRNYMPLSTADLTERVRQLCNDGRLAEGLPRAARAHQQATCPHLRVEQGDHAGGRASAQVLRFLGRVPCGAQAGARPHLEHGRVR